MVDTETKIQRYDSYKDSGVSWLEEIPKHWELKRFKHLFKEKKITHNVDLKCGSISFGKVVYKDDEKIPVSTKKSYQVLNKGEFLINPLNLNYDLKSLRIGLSDKDVVVSSGYIIVQNISELSKDYFKWLLHIFDVAYMKTLGSGVRQTLSFTHIANSELVFPPPPEQTAIAQFLDDKTTKIDQAIAIKQQQIALLKERKQILIHKAVTRGLNDNVALKDSGVEWIGEIPEHWEVKKLKYIANIFRGAILRPVDDPRYFDENGKWTYLNISDATACQKYLDYGKLKLSELGSTKSARVYPGNLIVTASATIGKPFINRIPVCVHDGFIPLVDIKCNIEYLYCFIGLPQIYISMGKSNTQKNIYLNEFKDIKAILPPLSEQKEIAQYIEMASAKIETAMSLKEQEISKLQEYKSSLINSVVTGKVRVC